MKNRGFTLIELMITIAILAIIIGIAVPAYQNQIEKTRRADAIAGLTQAAQRMERCFTRSNSYANCTIPSESPDGHYAISAATQTATEYSLVADPDGASASQAQKNDDCNKFTLNHLGTKGNDPENTSDRCWGSS